MDTNQTCRNCGYLGKTFPWCRSFRKAVKLDEGADCTRWSDSHLAPPSQYAYRTYTAPEPPKLPEIPSLERIESDHQAAFEADMQRDAIRYVWKIAYHAGYLYGVHMRACGLEVREKHGLVANPYREGAPMAQWAHGYARGFDGLEEE